MNEVEYKYALRKIELLLGKGSQGISAEEMHEVTLLRRAASEYEVKRYDYVQQSGQVSEAV